MLRHIFLTIFCFYTLQLFAQNDSAYSNKKIAYSLTENQNHAKRDDRILISISMLSLNENKLGGLAEIKSFHKPTNTFIALVRRKDLLEIARDSNVIFVNAVIEPKEEL